MTVLDLHGARPPLAPLPDDALVIVWGPGGALAGPADLEATLLDGWTAVIPHLAATPSRIVNLVVVRDGDVAPMPAALAAAVSGWGRGLARESARSSQTVNTVVGSGGPAAELVGFLAGPDAGYVTGQTLGLRPGPPTPSAARPARPAHPSPTVLISGGSGDLGRAISARLTAGGWRVVVGHRPGTAPASGQEALPLDLTDGESIGAAVAQLGETVGPLDGLVLNAGWTDTGPFVGSTAAARTAVVRINLTGPARLLAGLDAARLLAPGAVVVATGSEAGRIGEAGRAAYSGAKAGVAALMAALDGPDVRALATAPGPYDTTLLRETWSDPQAAERGIERLRQLVPLRRLGRAEELAAAVAFALSPAGEALGGQTLSVGGGITMV